VSSSLKPISRCKRGLQDISAALVSTEKPSLTSISAQGVQMHPSHQAQSSSKQKVKTAPPGSAISEDREGERPQRTAESGNVFPQNSKCSGHKDTGQRKDTARQTPWRWEAAGHPAPASPLLSATPPAPPIQAWVYLPTPTLPHPAGPQAQGDQDTGSNTALWLQQPQPYTSPSLR